MVLVNKGFKIFFLTLAAPPRMIEDMEKYGVPYHNMAPTVDAHTLSTFYNTIDILAHARADGETFGSNIAEAMMHGKPVVTHVAVPSHPRMGVFQAQTELVQDDVTGYVVPHDVPAYAFALEQLITIAPLRKKLGTTGREWAEKNCSTEACGAKLHQTYQDLLYRYAHQIRSRS
jgi:glycosyltransferase involved in cell wall biosynthesis